MRNTVHGFNYTNVKSVNLFIALVEVARAVAQAAHCIVAQRRSSTPSHADLRGSPHFGNKVQWQYWLTNSPCEMEIAVAIARGSDCSILGYCGPSAGTSQHARNAYLEETLTLHVSRPGVPWQLRRRLPMLQARPGGLRRPADSCGWEGPSALSLLPVSAAHAACKTLLRATLGCFLR